MTIKDFWLGTNNPKLPKSEYLFGTRHIILLILVVISCVTLTLIFRKKTNKTKWILMNILASILLFFEISSRIVNLIKCTNYTLEEVSKILLPMHVCSVMVWIFIISVFTKNQVLINFATIGGLIATLAFLLYPAVGINRKYMSFDCLYSTISHAVGFNCAILFITLSLSRFEINKIWQTFLCFIIMFLWGVLLDFVIFPGADYMYLRNDPLELEIGFPYQVLYGIILVVYILLFYLPPLIYKKIKIKQQKNCKKNKI